MSTNYFNLVNFYIFLIEFGFSILFLLIFSCIHYGIINSTKWGIRIQKSKSFNFLYYLIFGFLLSSMTFFVSQVSLIGIGNEVVMPITIIGLIYAMTIFYNRSVQIGALAPTIIWIIYQYTEFKDFNLGCTLRILVVVILAITAIITTFIKKRKWPTFLISCGVALLPIIIVILSMYNEDSGFYCTLAIISILSTIFYFSVINFINKWLTHVSNISKQGAYVNKYYLIPNVLKEYFSKFILDNKINQALVVSFNVLGSEKEKQNLLEKIFNKFNDGKTLFFKSSYTTYGFILTNNNYFISNLNQSYLGNLLKTRKNCDSLKFLEQQLLNLDFKVIKIRAYASVYGVHSCDINELIQYNQLLLEKNKWASKTNIVQLFDRNIFNNDIADNKSYLTLIQKINLEDITIKLETLKINASKKVVVYPRYYWLKKLTCDINEIINELGVTVGNTLLRYLAKASIDCYVNEFKYKNYPLLIHYPIDSLNSNENFVKNLLEKFNQFSIDKKKIIFLFDIGKYKQLTKQILLNLRSLEFNRISYWLTNAKKSLNVKNLHPRQVIFDI